MDLTALQLQFEHPIVTLTIANKFGQEVLTILDGKNRWVACRLAGVEPCYVDETPALTHSKKESATLDRVFSENLSRRQLNAAQRAVIAERIAVAQRGGKQDGVFTSTDAARQLKTSLSNLGKVRKIKEKAPKIYGALTRGDYKNVDAAYKVAFPNNEIFTVTPLEGGGYEIVETVGKLDVTNDRSFRLESRARFKRCQLLALDRVRAQAAAQADVNGDKEPDSKKPRYERTAEQRATLEAQAKREAELKKQQQEQESEEQYQLDKQAAEHGFEAYLDDAIQLMGKEWARATTDYILGGGDEDNLYNFIGSISPVFTYTKDEQESDRWIRGVLKEALD